MLGKAPDSILRAGALGTLINASTYGRTIPLIYGTTRSPIIAIWAANLRKAGSSKKAKLGKGATTYAENIDMLLGHNPLLFPLQVWDNANTFYPLIAKKHTFAVADTVTIPDADFYAVIAVTQTRTYDVTFNDYGGQGSQHLTGSYDQPLWNSAFNGPDPCNTSAYSIWWPWVYKWLPGAGTTVVLPYLANAFVDGTINVYYAAVDPNGSAYTKSNTGAKNTSEIPISALRLEWETILGQGDEYALAGLASQQIEYPWFAGVMSPNIDLGASGAIPNINIEQMGSFVLYPDPTLDTMGGDADYADMITDIFTSGPAQGGYDSATQTTGALGLTAVQHGLNCNNFPGIVQKHVWESSNFEAEATNVYFDAAVTAGSFLVAFFRNDTAASHPTGITDTQGNTWTEILVANPSASSNNVYGWYAQAKATGPNAVSIIGGDFYHQQLELFEVAGFDTVDEVSSASGNSGTPTLTIGSTTQRARQGMMFAWWNFLEPGYSDLTKAAARWQLVTGLGVNDSTPEYGVVSEFKKVYAPTTVTVAHPATYTGWAGCAISFKSVGVPQYPVSLGNLLDWDTMSNARLGARAAGLWGSININSSRKAGDVLKDLYASMNAAPVFSGFALKSIAWSEVSIVGNGAIFNAPTAGGPIAHLGPADFIGDDKTPPGGVGRIAEVDRPPILSMQILDRANNYNQNLITMPEAAGVALFGVRKTSPMKRDEIQDPFIAEMLLGIASRRQVYIRNTYKYKLNMTWALLEPMDLVTISDPQIGLVNFPVRVTSVQQDDKNALDVEFEPFIYGLHDPRPLVVTGNTPFRPAYGADPGSVNAPIFIEAVPQLALAPNTEDLIIVLSGQSADYGGAVVYISTDGGASYQTQQAWVAQGNAVTGHTVGDWPAHADPDMADNLTVDLSESNGELSSYTPEQRDAFGFLFYVAGGSTDIPYEIGAYNDAELTGTATYTIFATGTGNAIRRAVYDAPQVSEGTDHPNGSRFAFLGNPVQKGNNPGIVEIPMQPAWIGKTLYFKFQAFNQFNSGAQSLADCTPYTFAPTGLPGSVNPLGFPPPGGITPTMTTMVIISVPEYGTLVTLDNASPIAVTLDSTVPDNFTASVQNIGTAAATLTPSSGLIDGAADLVLPPGQGIGLFFDGTNWTTFTGSSATVPTFADAQAVSGTINGSNVTFTLPSAPNPAASLILPLNGVTLTQGVDYTLSSLTITMTTAPATGDVLGPAWYRH